MNEGMQRRRGKESKVMDFYFRAPEQWKWVHIGKKILIVSVLDCKSTISSANIRSMVGCKTPLFRFSMYPTFQLIDKIQSTYYICPRPPRRSEIYEITCQLNVIIIA
jgi:hypothetical protein